MFKSESNTQPAGLAMFANSDENFMNLINRVSDNEAQMLKGGIGSEGPPGLNTTPPGLEDDKGALPGKKKRVGFMKNANGGSTPPGQAKAKPFSDPDLL